MARKIAVAVVHGVGKQKVDFAKAFELSVPADHTALKRWYEAVSGRPSAAA